MIAFPEPPLKKTRAKRVLAPKTTTTDAPETTLSELELEPKEKKKRKTTKPLVSLEPVIPMAEVVKRKRKQPCPKTKTNASLTSNALDSTSTLTPTSSESISTIVPTSFEPVEVPILQPQILLRLKCHRHDLIPNREDGYVHGSNPSLSNPLDPVVPHDSMGSSDFMELQDLEQPMPKSIDTQLQELEFMLHHRLCPDSKPCACFWDTCSFDTRPVYLPKFCLNGVYHVYGCFCSPECAIAYLMDEKLDNTIRFERYFLFHHIYAHIFGYTEHVKPAPSPYYMLDKFYGTLSITAMRSLFRNERLFLFIDRPMSKLMPELHADKNEFCLTSKLIPPFSLSATTHVKKREWIPNPNPNPNSHTHGSKSS